jgi:carbon-monoxide dehydrogenase medium subunit
VALPVVVVHRPETVGEATGILAELGDDAAVYAGGTELVLLLKLRLATVEHLVDIKRIPELGHLGLLDDGTLNIGAAVTHLQIQTSPAVLRQWPQLQVMARGIGNVRVRAAGTIGGNLCFADSHSDPLSLLIALDAGLTLEGPAGVARTVRLRDFVRGPLDNSLQPAELLTGIQLSSPVGDTRVSHVRYAVGERPDITVSARVTVHEGSVTDACVVVGSVVPVPLVLQLDDALLGADLAHVADERILSELGRRLAASVPISLESRMPANYMRQLLGVLVQRAIGDCAVPPSG